MKTSRILSLGCALFLLAWHAQGANTVTFDNQSGQPALVKLTGPTSTSVTVENGKKETVNVAGGRYTMKARYGVEGKYSYSKGDDFDVMETDTSYSRITITLHKVVSGNYGSKVISKDEFEVSAKASAPGSSSKPPARLVRGMKYEATVTEGGMGFDSAGKPAFFGVISGQLVLDNVPFSDWKSVKPELAKTKCRILDSDGSKVLVEGSVEHNKGEPVLIAPGSVIENVHIDKATIRLASLTGAQPYELAFGETVLIDSAGKFVARNSATLPSGTKAGVKKGEDMNNTSSRTIEAGAAATTPLGNQEMGALVRPAILGRGFALIPKPDFEKINRRAKAFGANGAPNLGTFTDPWLEQVRVLTQDKAGLDQLQLKVAFGLFCFAADIFWGNEQFQTEKLDQCIRRMKSLTPEIITQWKELLGNSIGGAGETVGSLAVIGYVTQLERLFLKDAFNQNESKVLLTRLSSLKSGPIEVFSQKLDADPAQAAVMLIQLERLFKENQFQEKRFDELKDSIQ